MSKRLRLSTRLSSLAKGKDLLYVNGETVAECLDELVSLIPSMKKALFYKSGGLDPHVQVLVNPKFLQKKILIH